MPELPEVEAVRRELEPAMVGRRIVRVELRRPDLRTPFPRGFARRLTGATTLALTRRAKYLVAGLSSGESLLMHLGMSGSFRVTREEATAVHDHVVLHLSSGANIVFNDPRRFGFMDLSRTDRLDRHPSLKGLGPEPLSEAFDAAALARACAGKRTPLKSALLDQQVAAGLGNIYAVEALHIAGLSPQRQASTIATPGGAPGRGGHQTGAGRGDRASDVGALPRGAVSRVRPRAPAVPPPALHRRHTAPHSGGPFDLFLPGLSAIRRQRR